MDITRYLYELGGLGNGAITWISTAASLITIVSIFLKKNKSRKDNKEKNEDNILWALENSMIMQNICDYWSCLNGIPKLLFKRPASGQ